MSETAISPEKIKKAIALLDAMDPNHVLIVAPIMQAQSDLIQSQQAEIERLREALECLARSDDGMTSDIAHAALQEGK